MAFRFLFRRQDKPAARPVSERDVLTAGEEFLRKEKLVDQFPFLPPEMNKAAKETALGRFLDILFSHLRS